MDDTVNINVLGAGNHTVENLLPALASTTGVRVVSIRSRDIQKAKAVAAQFDVASAGTVEGYALVKPNSSTAEAVVVSTTPEHHEKTIMTAVEQGINIFVEKPPAANLKSMLAIQAAVLGSTQPPVVQFGFNFRHSEFYKLISSSIDKGGRAMSHMSIKSYASKPTSPMWGYTGVLESSLYAVHIHAIEMLCYALGDLISSECKITWFNKSRYVAVISASFVGGKTGLLELSNISNRFEFDVECIDSNQNIYRCQDFNQLEIYGPDYSTEELFQSKSLIKYNIPFLRGGYGRTGYSGQFDFFRDSILKSSADLKSIQSCVDAYKIIDRIISND